MNDALIRKFCESPSRWPVVAIGTTLLTLALVYPLADDYFEARSRLSDLQIQLVEAEITAAALPAEEEEVADLVAQLDALEQRALDGESVARFRSRLIELIRESGCQVRRLDVGDPQSRPWSTGDHVIDETKQAANLQPTPFQLERRSVLLAVDGSMAEVHGLLQRIESERQLAHPHRLQLISASHGGKTVMMELELWYFALAR